MYILLDLDNCLIHTANSSSDLNLIVDNPDYISMRKQVVKLVMDYNGSSYEMLAVKRPYLDNFLEFCQRRYKVGVWSAGHPSYVNAVVKEIFKNLEQPIVVMTGDDKVDLPNKNYHKPLAKFFERIPDANERNTIFIDDRSDNFLTHPRNGLVIPYYQINFLQPPREDKDECLAKIMYWLSKIENTKDVRDVIDSNVVFTSSFDSFIDYVDFNPRRRIPLKIKQSKFKVVII